MMRSVWQALVSEYTRRHLTYQTDRLVGLSGLAGAWECSEDDIYLAGLWKRQLPRYLVWYAHGPSPLASKRESRRHESYYAPSWSWASVDGEIEFHHLWQRPSEHGTIVAETLEVKVEPLGVDPFGRVRSGYARLLVSFSSFMSFGTRRGNNMGCRPTLKHTFVVCMNIRPRRV